MVNYKIFTDSSCDLNNDMVEELGVNVMQLEVIIDNNEPVLNRDINALEFYEQLKNGAMAKTSAMTPGQVEEAMEAVLKEGYDIIYIGFSSGLSATYNNGKMVMEDLAEKYPERKLIAIDSLCASAGQGLLVYYATKLRDEGATIEELAEKVEAIKQYIHHEVTVNDLFFLKRGGRINATTAVAGSVLNIKPMIHVDEDGKLQTIGKVRGRKNAIKELYKKFKENEKVAEFPYVFISNGGCYEEAAYLADMIKGEYPEIELTISDIGPVIGAHAGPGTIALFFLAKDEKGNKSK